MLIILLNTKLRHFINMKFAFGIKQLSLVFCSTVGIPQFSTQFLMLLLSEDHPL
jgi:hypothetical protein